MKIEMELTYLISLVIVLVGAFWAIARMMLERSEKHIEHQFTAVQETLKSQDEGTRRIERDLMELKAELPRDYVRREDQNRRDAMTQVSIDNLRLTIERFMLQGKPNA